MDCPCKPFYIPVDTTTLFKAGPHYTSRQELHPPLPMTPAETDGQVRGRERSDGSLIMVCPKR